MAGWLDDSRNTERQIYRTTEQQNDYRSVVERLSISRSVVLSFFVGVARRKRNLVLIYRRSDLMSQTLAEDFILTNHIRHLPAEQKVLP